MRRAVRRLRSALAAVVLANLMGTGACKCIGWRQTGGCNPDGPREPDSDLGCDEVVPSGSSGYCECAHGRASPVRCDHAPFACKIECRLLRPPAAAKEDGTCITRSSDGTCAAADSVAPAPAADDPLVVETYTCLGWRQSHDCDPNGRRDPRNDKRCDETVPPGASGCARLLCPPWPLPCSARPDRLRHATSSLACTAAVDAYAYAHAHARARAHARRLRVPRVGDWPRARRASLYVRPWPHLVCDRVRARVSLRLRRLASDGQLQRRRPARTRTRPRLRRGDTGGSERLL